MTNRDVVQVVGARVVLREPLAGDIDVLAYWLEPDHRWQELDGPMGDLPAPDDREDILAARRAMLKSPSSDVPRRLLSIATLEDGESIGQVTWEVAAGETTDTPGLNIVIYNPDLWGYGLGYEAFGLWVDYLFTVGSDLPHLELRTWSRNEGMVRLAHKLGFDEVTPQRYRRGLGFLARKPEGVGFLLQQETWVGRVPGGFAVTLVGDE